MERIIHLKKVAWASSIAAFDPEEKYSQEYVPHDALCGPLEVYGACKALHETVAAHYFTRFGVNITALRYSAVYGSGPRVSEAFNILCGEMVENLS